MPLPTDAPEADAMSDADLFADIVARTANNYLCGNLETQAFHWAQLEERAAHAHTLRPLSPLESQWLDDYRRFFRFDTSQAALEQITRLIAATNNGKLMKQRLPAALRRWVPVLIAGGYLLPATFLHAADAVRLPDSEA